MMMAWKKGLLYNRNTSHCRKRKKELQRKVIISDLLKKKVRKLPKGNRAASVTEGVYPTGAYIEKLSPRRDGFGSRVQKARRLWHFALIKTEDIKDNSRQGA